MTDAPRIRCLRDAEPSRALDAAFATCAAGDVPLIGDARWSAEHWAGLCERFDGIAAPPRAAWATFTSGTTGSPRVVLRTEASWAASYPEISRLLALTHADVVALPVTVVSSMTVFQAAHARHVGASIELARHGRLDDAQLARATVVHATPLIVRDLVARIEAGAASRLRVALVGGDHAPGDLDARAAALGIRVVTYAGAAELSFVAMDAGDGALRPFAGVDLRVDDDAVLWVRSPFAALGYAADTRGPLRRDDEGWVTVGDRAALSRDDVGPRLALLGRDDDAILSAGATIVPRDVEACFRDAPGVAHVAVVGVPARRVGDLVGVLLEPARPLDDPDAWARSIVARAMRDAPRSHRPRLARVVDRLPRTSRGKLDRAAARRLLGAPDSVRVRWSDEREAADDR